jgi:hypothetical protein
VNDSILHWPACTVLHLPPPNPLTVPNGHHSRAPPSMHDGYTQVIECYLCIETNTPNEAMRVDLEIATSLQNTRGTPWDYVAFVNKLFVSSLLPSPFFKLHSEAIYYIMFTCSQSLTPYICEYPAATYQAPLDSNDRPTSRRRYCYCYGPSTPTLTGDARAYCFTREHHQISHQHDDHLTIPTSNGTTALE